MSCFPRDNRLRRRPAQIVDRRRGERDPLEGVERAIVECLTSNQATGDLDLLRQWWGTRRCGTAGGERRQQDKSKGSG